MNQTHLFIEVYVCREPHKLSVLCEPHKKIMSWTISNYIFRIELIPYCLPMLLVNKTSFDYYKQD